MDIETQRRCSIGREYHASPWENAWLQLVATHRADSSWRRPRLWWGCEELQRNRSLIDAWLSLAQQRLRNRASWSPAGVLVDEVMSYHVLRHESCRETVVTIEPLVSFLRHPHAICIDRSSGSWPSILSTDYLLPMHRKEAAVDGGGRRLFFDLGAGLYHNGNGDSLQWLSRTYARLGLPFDRIFAWEAQPQNGVDVLRGVPAAVVDVLSYFNVPVDPRPGAAHNPLRVMRAVARRGDFVVLKLDVDNCTLERQLLHQIMRSDALTALISELYFEHHVIDSPMNAHAWKLEREPACDESLADSYRLFSQLRARGIRAHSWI